jgi:hypothetical protein
MGLRMGTSLAYRAADTVPVELRPLTRTLSISQDDTGVNMEQWWNDIDRGKLKNLERNLSYQHFVHHMD